MFTSENAVVSLCERLGVFVLDMSRNLCRSCRATARGASFYLIGSANSVLSLTDSVLSNNTATSGGGGGVAFGVTDVAPDSQPSSSVGVTDVAIVVRNVTFVNNVVVGTSDGGVGDSGAGGGLAVQLTSQRGAVSRCHVALTSVCFVDNVATNGSGGGLYVGLSAAEANDSSITLADVRFDGNAAGGNGGGVNITVGVASALVGGVDVDVADVVLVNNRAAGGCDVSVCRVACLGVLDLALLWPCGVLGVECGRIWASLCTVCVVCVWVYGCVRLDVGLCVWLFLCGLRFGAWC